VFLPHVGEGGLRPLFRGQQDGRGRTQANVLLPIPSEREKEQGGGTQKDRSGYSQWVGLNPFRAYPPTADGPPSPAWGRSQKNKVTPLLIGGREIYKLNHCLLCINPRLNGTGSIE